MLSSVASMGLAGIEGYRVTVQIQCSLVVHRSSFFVLQAVILQGCIGIFCIIFA